MYDFYFGFYLSNVSNIYYSTKHFYIQYELLLQQNFYWHPLLFFAHYYQPLKRVKLFGFNPKNSLIATSAVSSFILPTANLLESKILT